VPFRLLCDLASWGSLRWLAGDLSPAAIGYSRHLSERLGVGDDYRAAQIEASMWHDPDREHGVMGAEDAMVALRAEMARRGWRDWRPLRLAGSPFDESSGAVSGAGDGDAEV